MNKNVAFIITIVGIVALGFGAYLYFGKEEPVLPKEENENVTPTENEARTIVSETIEKVAALYESPKSYFTSKEEQEIEGVNRIEVEFYETTVKSLYTENGIKELESATYGDSKFILTNDKGIFLLSKLPDDKYHSKKQVELSKFDIKENIINCIVTYYKYYVDDNSDVKVESNIINVKLIYKNKSWFVESFNYSY